MATQYRHARERPDTASGTGSAAPRREEVADALERLARVLVQRAVDPLPVPAHRHDAPLDVASAREAVRLLGRVTAGWPTLPDDAFPPAGAGFGSSVLVEDLDTGDTERCTLMAGALLDLDDGHVSLASPIGQALLGATGGEIIEVETPQRRRRLRVLAVRTLRELLEDSRRLA
ncbi:MAG TPA: GreA/GreB family elongation factor [Longimicrobiales bacterium]